MKKTLLVLFAVMGLGIAANAQSAIGLRGVLGTLYGAEISYQTPAWGQRVEADFGWNGHDDHSNIYLSGIYQWDWNIISRLNWYAGPGLNLGVRIDDGHAGFGIGILGQVGIEWTFPIPLKLSLDIRPQIDFIGSSVFNFGAALGVRYVF